jgi:hypothetical protein
MQEAGQEAIRHGGKGEDERVGGETRVMRRLCHTTLLVGTVTALLGWAVAAPALASSSAGPARWAITSVAGPAYFKPASSGDIYIVTATNVGGESTSGPVSITDTLHGNAHATAVLDSPEAEGGFYGDAFTKSPLSCTVNSPSSVSCGYAGRVDAGDTLTLSIRVDVTAAEGEHVENTAMVSGGAAAGASTSEPTTKPTPVTNRPVPFGVASLFAATSTSQAGAHPNFTTSFTTNWSEIANASPLPAAPPREVGVDLPPGLTGDALAVPRCSADAVRRELCDEDSAVGVATARTEGGEVWVVLVYNIVPYPGEPAAFAFTIFEGTATVRLDTSVIPNSDGEYAVHVSAPDLNDSEALLSSSVTLWGAPSLHNGPGADTRNEECREIVNSEGKLETVCATFGGPGGQASSARPFLRNPTSCAGSPPVGFEMSSWLEPPGVFPPEKPSSPLPTQTECGVLTPLFTPTLGVTPDTAQAGAPAGYAVNLEVPQSQSSQRLGTPDLKDATVTLPAGTVASPSAANGLKACSDAQLALGSTTPAACPPSSQIGTVEIQTPLLPKPLTGQVYLGAPECAPCGPSDAAEGRMVRLFLQAQYEDGSYVRIKLAGRTHVDQQTGQLTTVFENNPQQPFEKLTLHLDGGPGAPLANPSVCGTATTTSRLTPWSSTPAAPFTAEPSSSFRVEGCPAPRFAPSFTAGMTGTVQAGAYSPFSVTFSRTDQDQTLGGITVDTPPGLLGAVSHVSQCGEEQANAGTCGPESQIGDVRVAAGPGSNPYWITGGHAYLTGPYAGAPFGLSVVVPAVAGPFDLGREVVRARIEIDPLTAELTVISNPLPTQKDGIPFQVRTVNVNVNRPQFLFNATNCDAQRIAADISSVQGMNAAASWPYQPVNCAILPFRPRFSASTQAHTSKRGGASLNVNIASAGVGQANIAKVELTIPKILPSRLTTLQKACTAAVFDANPASCPPESDIATAIVHTPLLNSPLSGPVYFVSHGGAAFPDTEIVLQGEGVRLILDGHTDIKKGITFSRFESVPDAPFTSFEFNAPEGPHSIFGANGNLCQTEIRMPTRIVAQNGAVIEQNTLVEPEGCPNKIAVVSHTATKHSVTLKVAVPSAGRLTATGRGMTRASKASGGRGILTITLTAKGHRKHGSRIKLTFTRANGGKLTATAAVRLRG